LAIRRIAVEEAFLTTEIADEWGRVLTIDNRYLLRVKMNA
jgi:hypothetical protein